MRDLERLINTSFGVVAGVLLLVGFILGVLVGMSL